jgi:dodecin
MTHVAKIIELVGSSDKGWTEAAQSALDEAKKTVKDITGLVVNDMTASVDPNTNSIKEYKVGVKNCIWSRALSYISNSSFDLIFYHLYKF